MRSLPALLLILLASCHGPAPEPDAGAADSGPPDTGPPPDAGPPIERIPEATAAAGRESCAFGRGAMPWETIGEEHPIGDDIPIRRWVVLMQENRSFDHYFGTMEGIDGIPAGASNPDSSGDPVELFHTDEYCIDSTTHSWNGSHRQWNGGANDGFVRTNDPDGARAVGYFDGTDLPFYWDLFRTFATSDHHFCSVLGPTWVNRFYFLSGTSFGRTRNRGIPLDAVVEDGVGHVIYEQLDHAAVTWRVYHAAAPFAYGAYPDYAFDRAHVDNWIPYADPDEGFYAALAGDTLPEVSFLEPGWDFAFGVDATDEHAPANPQRGQAWVHDIVTALMASDRWSETAILITYDEHGGLYDHVPPPEACLPGDRAPELDSTDEPGDFDRYGFRVPLFVISPYARAGYASDQVTDHTSLLRLLQARYLLPAMSGRDANAWPLYDMFDFDDPPFETPPALADAPVDQAHVDACHASGL